MWLRSHAFVDGAYLRELADEAGKSWPDPRRLIEHYLSRPQVQHWGQSPKDPSPGWVGLTRLTFYDARPDNDSELDSSLVEYWGTVERLPDTTLGFGILRLGRRNRRRQKAVDTQLSVDMVVGAFSQIYDIAVLVAGDADYVPAVEESRRRGVSVLLLAAPGSVSEDLKAVVDRHLEIAVQGDGDNDFPPLRGTEGPWPKR